MKPKRLQVVEQPQVIAPRLTNPNFVYIPAAKTDILKRFRDLGWIPPSELKGIK